MIPYSKQCLSEQDIEAVVEVLKSDFITQGNAVPRFEDALAQYTGAQLGVVVNSGTSALHIACCALGLSADDWLWTSPISFVASANCARYCGAKVDFVDVSAEYPLIDPNALEDKLKKASTTNTLPKIIIPVHFAGMSCDMEAIHSLADKYGIFIIEDAAHALGGSFKNKKIGHCEYSSATILSFHPVKSITTGEGGAVLCNDKKLARKMQLLCSHHITREPSELSANQGLWYYEQIGLGYNYRMTDIQAALGISQLMRLDEFIQKRKTLALRYDDLLASLPVTPLPSSLPNCDSAYHLYPIIIKDTAPKSRAEVFQSLRNQNIGVNVHYIPIYAHPYYQTQGFNADDFPHSQDYYARAISLPLYPSMSEVEQDEVVRVLRETLS